MQELLNKIDSSITRIKNDYHRYDYFQKVYKDSIKVIVNFVQDAYRIKCEPEVECGLFASFLAAQNDLKTADTVLSWFRANKEEMAQLINFRKTTDDIKAILNNETEKKVHEFKIRNDFIEFIVRLKAMDENQYNNYLLLIKKVNEFCHILIEPDYSPKYLKLNDIEIDNLWMIKRKMKELTQIGMLLTGKKYNPLFWIKSGNKRLNYYLDIQDYIKTNSFTDIQYNYICYLLILFKDAKKIENTLNILRDAVKMNNIEAIKGIKLFKNWLIDPDIRKLDYDIRNWFYPSLALLKSADKKTPKQLDKHYKESDKAIKYLEDVKKHVIKDWNSNRYIYLREFNFRRFDEIGETNLKNEVILYIYQLNQNKFKDLKAKNDSADINAINELEKIAADYDLHYKFSTGLANIGANKLRNILGCLKETKMDYLFAHKDLLEKVITYCCEGKIRLINQKLLEHNIPKEFVLEHSDIFSTYYHNFITNIFFIERQKITVDNYEILLEEPKVLIERSQLANIYGINLRKNSNYNDDFLSDFQTFDIFDQYIELGYYNFIKNHLPYCTKENENIIKRLYIANILNLDIIDGKDFIKEIITGKGFIVPDEYLDNYIYNFTDKFTVSNYKETIQNNENTECNFENDIIKELDEKYLISNYEYNFKGIIISRIKVIRNFTLLIKQYPDDDINDLLFNAIIYNSILSYAQIVSIQDAIHDKKRLK